MIHNFKSFEMNIQHEVICADRFAIGVIEGSCFSQSQMYSTLKKIIFNQNLRFSSNNFLKMKINIDFFIVIYLSSYEETQPYYIGISGIQNVYNCFQIALQRLDNKQFSVECIFHMVSCHENNDILVVKTF